MLIDLEKYKLSEGNFYNKEFQKTQIVLGNTFNNGMDHVNGWIHRNLGTYKKTSTFSIDRKGNVYQHYDPIYYSDFIGNKHCDKKIISILIENRGWLLKDSLNNKYIDWVGNIYNRKVNILEKRWRGYTYWEPYTNKQLNSTIELVNYLCDTYSIKPSVVGHNTYIDDITLHEGIAFRSNYSKHMTDLNPAWDYINFKNKIEEKNKKDEFTR